MNRTTLAHGERVADRHDPERGVFVVVNRPAVPCNEWEVGDQTVAKCPGNRAYPDESPVVVVVFAEDLARTYSGYDGNRPIPLSKLNAREIPYFAFPPERLAPVDEVRDPPPVFDALADRLAEQAETEVELTTSPPTLRVDKPELGETYRVTANGTVHGDGLLRGRLEIVVNEVVGS